MNWDLLDSMITMTELKKDNLLKNGFAVLLELCRKGGEKKTVMGIKIIYSMIRIVRKKLDRMMCDGVMVAWYVMSFVTDETPVNSERFLQCRAPFPNSLDLLRHMMRLLSNVAKVKQYRKRLMTSAFVEEFNFLMDSQRNGIEGSINTAAVLWLVMVLLL